MIYGIEKAATNLDQKKERFLAAYDAHVKSIYRYIYYRTGQEKEEAQELAQEVFTRTWGYLMKDGRPIEDIRAFLFQVSRHVIADRWRKHKPSVPLDELEPNEEPGLAPTQPASVDVILLEQFLLQLPENYREVLTLRYVNDLTTEETGKILGITANNAAVMTSRALARLRKLVPRPAG